MGLTTEEARRRLSQTGPNEPAAKPHSTLLPQALRLFLDPLVLILLISSAISAVLGERTSASIIASEPTSRSMLSWTRRGAFAYTWAAVVAFAGT